MTGTLSMGIAVNSTVEEIFQALTDSTVHSHFTEAESHIKPQKDGEFSYYGGALTGTFLEIVPNVRIIQSLHAQGWPDNHTATVTINFKSQANGQGSWVEILEENIPDGQIKIVTEGWARYWEQLSIYLRDRKTEIVSRFVEEYKNKHNWDCVDEFLATDCKHELPLPLFDQGIEGMRLNGKTICTAFPDVHVTRDFFVTEGDMVIERARANATHKGELAGLDPTNKPVTWTELHAYRVKNGKITDIWSEASLLGVLEQIGAVNLPAGEQ